jgi:flagellar assembly protein FliH
MSSDPLIQAVRAPRNAKVASFWDEASGSAPLPAPGARKGQPQAPAAPARPAEEVVPRAAVAELEREAFAKGHAQGERAGVEAATRRAQAVLSRLTQTVEEMAGLRTELVQKTERQVVQLALAIAGRVLRREVSMDRELLVAIALVALERLGESTSATIRLNPDDHAFLGGDHPQGGNDAFVRIAADPLVAPGGCLVQSDFGLIDAGIDAQLEEIASALDVPAPARGRTARNAA